MKVSDKNFIRLLTAAYDLKTFREGSESYDSAVRDVDELYDEYGHYIQTHGWITPSEFYCGLVKSIPSDARVLVDMGDDIKESVVCLIPIHRLLDGSIRRLKVIK